VSETRFTHISGYTLNVDILISYREEGSNMKSIKSKKGVIFLEYLLLLLMVLIAWQGVRLFGQSMGLAYQQAGKKMQLIGEEILNAPVCNISNQGANTASGGNLCFGYVGNGIAGLAGGINGGNGFAVIDFKGEGSFNFGNHAYAQGSLSGGAAGGAIGFPPGGAYIVGGQISGEAQAGGGQGFGAGGFGIIGGTAYIPAQSNN